MGQLKSIDLPEPGARGVEAPRRTAPTKTRWWLWIPVLAVIALGIWYFRSSRAASLAANSGAPSGASKGKGGAGAGNFTVPVIVATAQRGDLPYAVAACELVLEGLAAQKRISRSEELGYTRAKPERREPGYGKGGISFG